LLCRLHDTRLEPTHDAVGFQPINGVPFHRVAGGRTSPGPTTTSGRSRPLMPSSALPPESVCQTLVLRDQMDVCALSRGMMSPPLPRWPNPYPRHCNPAFAFSILMYPLPVGVPHGTLSP
jgi:hypothetical protein